MNKKGFILYLMDEYKVALFAIEAEEEWYRQEEKEAWGGHSYYPGRHVSKAELKRIRLMLHKTMLEVEEGY